MNKIKSAEVTVLRQGDVVYRLHYDSSVWPCNYKEPRDLEEWAEQEIYQSFVFGARPHPAIKERDHIYDDELLNYAYERMTDSMACELQFGVTNIVYEEE